MTQGHVVVVGSHVQGLFMRVSKFPAADETVLGWEYKEALDGGKGSHQAIACSRLGLPTRFIGRVGMDRLGDVGASWMADAGVDLTYLFRSKEKPTGCGFVMIDPAGIPAMATAMGANSDLSVEDIDRAAGAFEGAAIVLITFEIPVDTALYAAARAKRAGAFAILTPGPAQELARGGLASIDLVVPNRGEAAALLGLAAKPSMPPAAVAERLTAELGASMAIITLGEEGALIWNGRRAETVPAFRVRALDTPGAGDAFTAGLAGGIFHRAPLRDAVRYGCLTAARAVTVRESLPGFGTMAEIEAFAKENGFEVPSLLSSAASR